MHLFAHKKGIIEALPLFNELAEVYHDDSRNVGHVWEMLKSVHNNSLNPHTEGFNFSAYMYYCWMNDRNSLNSSGRQFVYIIENAPDGPREPFTVLSDKVSGEVAQSHGYEESKQRDVERRLSLEALLTYSDEFYRKGYLLKRVLVMAAKGYKAPESILKDFSRRNKDFKIELIQVFESWDIEELIEELQC